LCRRLASAGIEPIVGYRDNVGAALRIAKALGGRAIQVDLSCDQGAAQAIDLLEKGLFNISGLVLCASPPPKIGPFTNIAFEDMVTQWQVNVAGPQRLLAGVIRRFFRPQKSGTVVFVLTSAMGNETVPAKPNMGAYVIAKYGLLGLKKALEAEFPWLDCHEIMPGFMETNMLTAFDSRYLELERSRDPRGRFSTADEVAAEVMKYF